MRGVGLFFSSDVCQLGPKNRQLDWCDVGVLHGIDSQCLEDIEARELKITRKVEGADRLEKTEVSKSWKSQ